MLGKSEPWYAFVPPQRDLSQTSILYYRNNMDHKNIWILQTGKKFVIAYVLKVKMVIEESNRDGGARGFA